MSYLITREEKGSKLTIPEMDGNLLYLQSLGKPEFNDITSGVTGGVYTVTDSDFLTTLVYTGSSNINVQLASSLELVSGSRITLLQKGSGQMTVVGSGVTISTTADVVATTYGANAMADVIVYSSVSPEVIVTGKLKFA
jgi:hypothetical protein